MGVCSVCMRFLSLIMVLVAVLFGYVATSTVPMGTFFWLLHQPFVLQDYYNGKLTPEVPQAMQPGPRPANEVMFTLPSGNDMPASGIGMCCRGTAYHSASVYNTVLWYLLQGGRHVDTADVYVNHRDIGRAIQEAIRRGVPRSEMFITTKIWPASFGKSSTEKYVDRVLEELNLGYVDLVLLHAPRDLSSMIFGGEAFSSFSECKSQVECWGQTWAELGEARASGKIKDVGISNFNIDNIKLLQTLDAVQETPIAVNQLPFNPWVPQWQKDVSTFCQENGIRVTGYISFGGMMGKHTSSNIQALTDIADSYNVSTFQVLARWSLQRGVIIIPGTGKPKNMLSNLNVHSFELSDSDMATLNTFSPEDEGAPPFFALNPPEHAK